MDIKNKKILIGALVVGILTTTSLLIILSINTQHFSGNLSKIGQIETNGLATTVQVRGKIAYVIDSNENNPGGLMLINISNPEQPVLLGSYYEAGMPNDFALQGDLAYVSNSGDGLEILNVSNPDNIVRIGHYRPGKIMYDVEVRDNIAFLASNSEGLEILNISDPTVPQRISKVALSNYCINVFVEENYCYASGFSTLEVVDISNPSTPQKVEQFSVNNHLFFYPIKFGDIIYIADHGNEGDMIILDSSDPTNINEVGRVSKLNEGYARRTCVNNSIAYMAFYSDGLLIVDMSYPNNPEVINHFKEGGKGYDIAINGDYIYFAAGSEGLQILHHSD